MLCVHVPLRPPAVAHTVAVQLVTTVHKAHGLSVMCTLRGATVASVVSVT
jgi:hypothetical protein